MWRGRISENKGVGETSVGESCGVLQRKFTVDRERVDCIRGLQRKFTRDRGRVGLLRLQSCKKKKKTTATALLNETITLKVPVLFFLFFLTIK